MPMHMTADIGSHANGGLISPASTPGRAAFFAKQDGRAVSGRSTQVTTLRKASFSLRS